METPGFFNFIKPFLLSLYFSAFCLTRIKTIFLKFSYRPQPIVSLPHRAPELSRRF
jgi:hypothetical protein